MNEIDLTEELRIYNSILRFSYKRSLEDLKEKEVRSKVNSIFRGKLNSWIIQCAIKDGISVAKRFGKDKKVIFGGKSKFKRFMKGLISKDELKEARLKPMTLVGEALRYGNRLVDFYLNENKVVLKLNRNKHINIKLPNLRKKLQKEFNKLQELIDQKKATITVQLNNKEICFIYDENLISKKKLKNLKENRILGLDLNPNYIGLSILEFKKNDEFEVLKKQVYDLKNLNKRLKVSSYNKKQKKQNNKRDFELIEICYDILKMVDYWKCQKVVIEDLNIKSSDKGLNKEFNRLCNNVWNKNLVVKKLKMLSNIYKFELVEVNPAYSSFVGNILFGSETCPDMISSSIEIARRGFKKFEKGWFYPKLELGNLNERWKQTLDGVKTWKDFYLKIKKFELKYRFLLQDYFQNAVFSKVHKQKRITIYQFL